MLISYVVVGGAVPSCAGINAPLVCTVSSKQIYPVSVQLVFPVGEVSHFLGLSLDLLSMFFSQVLLFSDNYYIPDTYTLPYTHNYINNTTCAFSLPTPEFLHVVI